MRHEVVVRVWGRQGSRLVHANMVASSNFRGEREEGLLLELMGEILKLHSQGIHAFMRGAPKAGATAQDFDLHLWVVRINHFLC